MFRPIRLISLLCTLISGTLAQPQTAPIASAPTAPFEDRVLATLPADVQLKMPT